MHASSIAKVWRFASKQTDKVVKIRSWRKRRETMTCFELRRKWWHRVTIGMALLLATLSAGAMGMATRGDRQALWNFFGGPMMGAIVVFLAVFFVIFIPYRILVRVVVGKIPRQDASDG